MYVFSGEIDSIEVTNGDLLSATTTGVSFINPTFVNSTFLPFESYTVPIRLFPVPKLNLPLSPSAILYVYTIFFPLTDSKVACLFCIFDVSVSPLGISSIKLI